MRVSNMVLTSAVALAAGMVMAVGAVAAGQYRQSYEDCSPDLVRLVFGVPEDRAAAACRAWAWADLRHSVGLGPAPALGILVAAMGLTWEDLPGLEAMAELAVGQR